MNDTTRRFLSAIVERLPPGRVVELRLFPAIRQSAMESGAAVIAVELADGRTGGRADGALELAPSSDANASDEQGNGEEGRDDSGDELIERAVASSAAEDSPYRDEEGSGKREEGSDHDSENDVYEQAVTSASEDAPATFEMTPPTDPSASPPVRLSADPSVRLSRDPSAGPAVRPSAPDPTFTRYAVFSARYRLTLKGSERGNWEVELRHEADAPLDTVERVARGVAKRAGDESDPEHFSGESLRDALEAPAWATTL